MLSKEVRATATATGNVHENLVKFGLVVSNYANSQTDRQIKSSQYFAPLPRGEVIMW